MLIYPTIELQDGRPVTLNRGRLDEPQIWHVDPVAKAESFAADGAEWMHLTDFDAILGDNRNLELVEQIIRRAGIPVQLAGGFRTADGVAEWIDRGAGRIVLSTMAVRDPQSVKALAKRFPDQIVIAVDVWNGQVMVDGWRQAAALSPEAFMAGFDECPLAAFIVTDIDSDMEDADASLGLVTDLAGKTRIAVIASGLVRELDDVARLKYVRNVAGTLIGRALFRKNFSLEEALTVARPDAEPVAEFL